MKLLRVEGLVKHYRLRSGIWPPLGPATSVLKALDGVSFEMSQGEALGVVGESGSGKTTLSRCILRLEAPTRGRIFFKGEDWIALSERRLRPLRRLIQPVFQDPYSSLNPLMTVADIVSEPLVIHGLGSRLERSTRVAELLDQVGLDPAAANRRPHEFSGGQRQRIAIARALATRPELILADEPLSALDVSVQCQILNLLERLKGELGLALLFISHSLPVVRQLCDRVAVIFRGRLVELAPSEKLFVSPRHPYTQRLLSANPLSRKKAPEASTSGWESQVGELQQVDDQHWVALGGCEAGPGGQC